MLGHFESGKAGLGPGPGAGVGDGGVKKWRGGVLNPSFWKLAQTGYPWGVPVSLSLRLGVMESGVPMPFLLPSLKLECEKLASEKTEMQRHYVMVRRLECQGGGSGAQGLARSENTWAVNPNSLGHSG